MDALKNLDLDHWWKLLAVAGALIAIASTPVQNSGGVFVGLGLLFFGIGEWINHPERTGLDVGMGSVWRITSHARDPRPSGLFLDAIGIALLLFGIYRLV